MTDIWIERMTDPDLLIGLGFRFFGVFAVLIIVMIGIWVMSFVIRRWETAGGFGAFRPLPRRAVPEPAPLSPSVGSAAETRPSERYSDDVSGETATAIALALEAARRQGSVTTSTTPTAEVAAVIGLALAAHRTSGQTSTAPNPGSQPCTGQGQRTDSPWKVLARQEAISRNDPYAGRWGAARGKANREQET